jgi:DNA primase
MHILFKRKISNSVLAEFNVFVRKNENVINFGKPVDIHDTRDGIYFPIYSLNQNLLGYTVRTFSGENKWFFCTTFRKNNYLYGFNKTYLYIKEQQKVIVVEGIFDFLKMYQCGFHNVVSCLGSSFSKMQFLLVYPIVNEIIALPDGDDAGEKLSIAIKNQVSNDIKVSYVKLPKNMDPDEFLLKYGKEKMKTLIESRMEVL